MLRYLLAVIFLSFTGLTAAQPPVAPAAPPSALKWIGRAKPAQNYDVGDYRAVVANGKTRYFPRLSKHTDLAKLAASLPEKCDWAAKAPSVLKRMYLNDRYGCCVISSRYHGIGFMTGADTGVGLEADDNEILLSYIGICGQGDNGCYMSAVNDYQQRVGLKVRGVIHKTRGSAVVDNTNKELVKGAIFYGGGITIGFSLPNSWFSSADGSTWDVTNSGTVGGHEVYVYGYNSTGVLLSTWGGWRTMTWAAFTSRRWIDECYVTLTADWYGSDNLAPNGVDVKGLEAAFAAIAGGTVPPLPDPIPPVPVPPTPVPPSPGKGYTGSITVTTTYKDGVVIGQPVTSLGGSGGAATVEAELKEAGVSPVLIVDILKLLADVRAKAGKDVIMADVLKILMDIGGFGAAPAPECCGGTPMSALWRLEDSYQYLVA